MESRARGGHFEGDLINGLHGTGNLVTLAERMTRFTFFDYVGSKESEAVMEVVLKLLGPLPPDLLKTLTFDNGKEFARFRVLEALGLKVYFARPYHSWERGTNENRNGIIRKVLPKGTAFNDLTEEQRRRIDYLLNDRSMRCLNWRTPREAFARLVLRVLGAPFGGRLRPPSRTGAPCGAPRPPCAPPVALRPALRATCRASTRRKNGLSGEPGGATMPPIHTEAPAWAGYAAGVALASCCRDV